MEEATLLYIVLIMACATSVTCYSTDQWEDYQTGKETNLISMERSSPCTSVTDEYYGGVVLDCSHQNIHRFESAWIPLATTTIKLNQNQLTNFQNDTFANAPGLRCLDFSYNNFKFLEPGWFRGTKSLEVFLAGNNVIRLGEKSFPENVFQFLPSLRVLDLGKNSNHDVADRYPDFLLKDLHNLEDLVLDTFPVELDFGSIFDNVTTLKKLKLTGGARLIRNDSFQNFDHIPLETLQLEDMDLLMDTEREAFSHLKSLKNFHIRKVRQDLNVTCLSLKPFVGRHFVSVIVDRLGTNFRRLSTFEGSKVVTSSSGKYLRNICIEHLSILSSDLLAVSVDFIVNTTLAKCLKSFNARNNPLYGQMNEYFEITAMKHLTTLTLSHSNLYPATMPTCQKPTSPTATKPGIKYDLASPTTPSLERYTDNDDSAYIPPGRRLKSKYFLTEKDSYYFQTEFSNSQLGESLNCTNDLLRSISLSTFGDNDLESPFVRNRRCLRIPPSLQYAFVVDMCTSLFALNYIVILWPNILKELYISQNGIREMTGQVIGFDLLEVLDMSHNDASEINPYFFDHFPSLKTLIIREINLDAQFIAKSSSRLFANLTNLQTLDLTNNGLSLFSDDTFKTNKLKVLILAENKFNSIPFKIENTPHLCLLNLTYNSIPALTRYEMNQLDAQATKTQGCFSLLLEGNILSCGCSSFTFLQWLQTTSVNLDNDGTYPCITEDGVFSNTSEFRDLTVFWRQCHGKTALLISIIMLVLMCFGFTIASLVYHFKTRLAGYVHQVILRKVKPKTPLDYSIGVCIEYSDHDATFSCLPLRSFIEEDLGLTTFVRHRDLLANQFRDVSISQAICHSWRVLLVITESYLNLDRWSFYTMKLASSSATVTNQAKIVLVVEEGLERKIPMCLLKAVQEGSVITVDTKTLDIPCDLKVRLRSALSCDTDLTV